MEKQKICVIGGGLTGLITAITLSKLNLKIDLITGNIKQDIKSNRTVAISQENYDFLRKLKIFKFSKKEFWPCSKMKLFTATKKKDFREIFELEGNKKKVLYLTENSKVIKQMIRNIKKNKIVSLKTQKMISEILPSGLLKSVKYQSKDNLKYNLVIICTGSNSHLVKKVFHGQSFERSYEEVSITTIVKHSFLKNNIVQQIFLDNEILALLPISNTKTSIVWSIKKDMMNKYKSKNDFFLKKRLRFYTKNFLKKVKFINRIEYKDLNFLIQKKYYDDRILLFGDALHTVHPLAGQGFNMVLRDLASLERIIKNKICLGLDIGSPEILAEVSDETKPRNFAYSLGINFLKNYFSFQEKSFKNFRNKTVILLNKNNFMKNIFFNFANKGFKF